MDPGYSLTPNKYLLPNEQAYLENLLTKYKVEDLRNTTMILLMLKTGARPSEILNLKWSDFNFVESSVFLKTLKGGKDRVIPLGPDLVDRLTRLRQPSGKAFNIGYDQFHRIWSLWRPVKKKLHCLRHTFAINLYRSSSFNLKLVQTALGHAHLQTTAIYLDIESSMDDLRKAICG